MEFFYHIKATQKSGKTDAVIWFTAKSEARAALTLDVELEEAGIETGRGKDYAKPVRTDYPIFNDLPEESTVDLTWCDRYELAEDQRTWNVKLKTDEDDNGDDEGYVSHIVDSAYTIATMSFRTQLLAQFNAEDIHVYHINKETQAKLSALEMDTDNAYVQNLLLAASNVPDLKKYDMNGLWKLTKAIKEIFPQDRRPELGLLIQFMNLWMATSHIDRGILTREWAAGNRIQMVQRTDAGTNADGGHVTDRGADVHHTLDTLDQEIACALLPMDFNHREIPGSIQRRAKEVVTKKEEPWKSWSKILRNQPGVLAVNRTAIFNLVRLAPDNIHLNPVAHLEFVNRTMTAEFNAAVDLLPFPEATSAPVITATTENEKAPRKSFCTHEENLQRVREEGARQRAEEAAKQPQVASLGGGVFSIEGLMGEQQQKTDDRSPFNEETTSDVQMEETNPQEGETGDALSPGESVDAAAAQTVALNPAEEMAAAAPSLSLQDPVKVNQNPENANQNDDPAHQNTQKVHQNEPEVQQDAPTMFTHLMVDLETMGKKPGAPIVSIGAVFFDPTSGRTGAEFYQVVDLESSMSFGAKPDGSTILWWLKQSPEARSAIVVDDTVGLVEALEQLLDFIAENAANGSKNVQLWGNGSSFDCSILEAAFELADTPFPIPHWNYRDVRTVVELGKAVDLNARYDIPFEGDQHNALADARHQVKYVSAIWQRLTAI